MSVLKVNRVTTAERAGDVKIGQVRTTENSDIVVLVVGDSREDELYNAIILEYDLDDFDLTFRPNYINGITAEEISSTYPILLDAELILKER